MHISVKRQDYPEADIQRNNTVSDNTQRCLGFTLVEILIVVIIIGILAAIIIPRFSTATDQARDSVLKDELKNIRTQMSIFAIQHLDIPPGVDSEGNVTEELFLAHLTGFSDVNGTTNATRNAQFRFGPYLSRIPENPINGKGSISIADEIPAECTGNDGWIYIPNSMAFIADLPGTGPDGKLYLDY